MKIPQDIIERLNTEIDIVELISDVVPLKRMGGNYKGLCPFHGEKNPSFVVTPQKHMFHCFGCGVGGDAIAFVMQYEKLSFVEAAQKLADRLHIVLPRTESENAAADFRQIYDKINAYAGWFFRERLKESSSTKNYIAKRGLSEKISELYELGFAPDGFENLVGFFRGKEVPIDKALELGLLRKSEKNGKVYDFFRDRLMFPIRSRQGKIVGFGGRTLKTGSDEAKYVNSSESPVYHKSRELYGFYQAKNAIATTRRAVVVEGNVDVLACAQLGIENVVAPLGTSLTVDQVKILKRHADDIVLMFDGDAAGQNAVLKGFATCLEAEVHPHVVPMPMGLDPGDIVLKPEAFDLPKAVKEAVHALDWLIAETARQSSDHPAEQAKALKKIAYFLDRLPDPMENAAYRQKLKRYFDAELPEMNKNIEKSQPFARVQKLGPSSLSCEELIVLTFVNRPEMLAGGELGRLGVEFEDEALRGLARYLDENFKNKETLTAPISISRVPRELQEILSRLLTNSESLGELNLQDLIRQNWQRTRKKRLKRITSQIMEAETSRNEALKMKLLIEKQNILKEKQ